MCPLLAFVQNEDWWRGGDDGDPCGNSFVNGPDGHQQRPLLPTLDASGQGQEDMLWPKKP